MIEVISLDDPNAAVKNALKTLKQLEPDTYKILTKDIKGTAKDLASQIASKVPTVAPLSGFDHDGRTKFRKVKAKGSFTPSKKNLDGGQVPLVSMALDGDVGFFISDLAGARGKVWKKRTPAYGNHDKGHAVTTQGQKMIEALNARYGYSGKAGRWSWKEYIDLQPKVGQAAQEILDKLMDAVNRELGN